ncbi:MAG: Dabb family protein [Vicinamibacterales bacterium]|jgi:hypothetical protein|nr:Dabb family protein [Vicinamibacterales bacterium]
MIAHLVLYRPKPGLEDEARQRFTAALVAARSDITAIRRFTIGRRLEGGPSYGLAEFPDFPYMAVIEFDDVAGLRAYLTHPVHAGLGQAFRASLASALVYDYAIADAAEAETFLA